MGKPNLFAYATSELSQDAFICWLLEWADKSNYEHDPLLHKAGSALLKALLKTHDVDLAAAATVKVIHQHKKIDILVEINDEFLLLIEDKTSTNEHDNQLKRYKDYALSEYKSRTILPVFVKTGDQSSYEEVIRAGYTLFLRKDFLEILQANRVDNAIFVDFLQRVGEWEAATESWKRTPVVEWKLDKRRWIGFFKELQQQRDLPQLGWGYVPNQQGGFYGAWWHSQKCMDGVELYLQIKEEDLEFRISANGRANLPPSFRKDWQNHLLEEADIIGLPLKPYGRSGRTMAIARLSPDSWMIKAENGLLDFPKTVEKLKTAALFLDGLVAQVGK